MSRSIVFAATLLLACADGPATAPGSAPVVVAPMAAGPASGQDTAAPGLDARFATALRGLALSQTPDGVARVLDVRCADPEAFCGYDTVQPDNEALAQLLATLERSCEAGPATCRIYLESIEATDDGRKRAVIALHPADGAAPAPPDPEPTLAPGALDEPTATALVHAVRADLPGDLRDDLILRCTPELGCSVRTEQRDNESIARLLSAMSDRCEDAQPAACAVWLTDIYKHPDNGRKVADIALTTAD
jgi:hypothetical protein